MIEGSAEFSERFGSVHMNETAMEYFQSASLAGKTSEQMIKEFQAIQRFKEEELIQQQLNQAVPNELEGMINDAANEQEQEESDASPIRVGAGTLLTNNNNDQPKDNNIPDKTI